MAGTSPTLPDVLTGILGLPAPSVVSGAAKDLTGVVSGVESGITTAGTTIAGPVVLLTKAGVWLANRDNWIRVAKVIGGMGLIWVGLARTGAGQRAAGLGVAATRAMV